MVIREKNSTLIPKTCKSKMICLFFIFIPMLSTGTLIGLWMYYTKKSWEDLELNATLIQEHTLYIGELIMNFNMERELTIIYCTARNPNSQSFARIELSKAQDETDGSLNALRYWPGKEEDGHMFKSPYLFAAVLNRHRELIKVGNYYQDELQFYSSIIDILFSWLTRDVNLYKDTHMWKWLLSYTYLLGSIHYLGAEQALCSVFFSMVCFSYRDTFRYVNYSYSGEATFRLYRQSFPDMRGGGWRTASHNKFFPNLSSCREEIIADLSYQGMSIDPSLCDEGRKNETRFHDIEILTLHEYQYIKKAIADIFSSRAEDSSFQFIVSGIVVGACAAYFFILHSVRCIFIKCIQCRQKHNNWGPKDVVSEDEKMNSLTLEGKLVQYEDYNHVNCRPNHIHVKVASV